MSGFDPTHRELCADGACIGVIGSGGTCNECGAVARSATTHSRLRGMRLPESEPESESETESVSDSDRELCADELCVGLIGPDGRCKTCGRTAGSAAPDSDDEAEADPHEDESADEDDRQLCPDDLCIGLIGPSGRCKECGITASSGG